MKPARELLIVGAGGHSRVVIDTAILLGNPIKGVVDIGYHNQKECIMGVPIVGGLDYLELLDPSETDLVVAIGDNQKRSLYYNSFKQKGFSFPDMIHPTAIVSKFSYTGGGVFINAGAIVNSKVKIGQNTIINTGSIIEHEVMIGSHCHICPGVKIGGRVVLKDNCFVGIGTSIIDYLKIGHGAVIGAGSVIVNDIEPESTYVGVPGNRIK